MNRLGTRLALVVFLIGSVSIYNIFFVDSNEVIDFNDGLVDLIQESNTNFTPVTETLIRYQEGDRVDVEALAGLQMGLLESLRQDQAKLDSTTVPDDDLCRRFHRACVEYIDNSIALAEQYAAVISHIREHNPATTEEEAIKVDDLLSELAQKDQELMNKVVECQELMAAEFDIQLQE